MKIILLSYFKSFMIYTTFVNKTLKKGCILSEPMGLCKFLNIEQS